MNIQALLAITKFYSTLPNNRECDGLTTPEALIDEAKYILTDLTINHKDIAQRSLDWLVQSAEGQMYERIRGRAYRPQEKDALARQRITIRQTLCPYHQANGQCLLGMTRPLACRVHRDQYAGMAGDLALILKKVGATTTEWGFLPALLAVELDRRAVITLIEEGRVADAKIALVKRPEVEIVATQKI